MHGGSNDDGIGSVKIGLALGAGGARGFAHIVALETLDDLGLRPALITGASMGAIIGACYAAGMSGRDIRAHATEIFRDRAKVMAALLQARVGKFADLFSRSPGNPALLDAEKLLDLFWPDAVPDRFDQLAIPFRAIATDFYGRSVRVFDTGALVTGVGASMAIPGLVRPVSVGGAVYIDGAVVNPLPFDLLDGVDVRIGVEVTGGPRNETEGLPEAFETLLGSSQIMMGAIVQEKLKSAHPDILLVPPVDPFAVLDFFRVREILDASAGLADELKRGIDAAITAWR